MSGNGFTLHDLKQLIIDSLQLEGTTAEMIGDEEPLFADGLGLDSVDALELVVAIEKRFGIKIRGDDFDPQTFATTASMFRFIETQMAEVGRRPG